MAPKVYSYARWSTPRQGKGHSSERQLQAAREYAARETDGLVVDEALVDEGRSAFRGSNVKKGEQAGALGRFLERIEAGDIERGSVLVLENLDRMSRMAPWNAMNILTAMVEAGIAVHTTNDGATYTAKKLNSENGLQSLFVALLAFNTANQESRKKAARLQDVWAAKRRNAAQKPLTAIGPKWLRLDKKSGKWKPIPERVKIVRRIFDEAIAGKGVQVIARTLNEEGVPVFGRSQHWHRAYIVKLLDNPAVIGTLIPHILTHDEETGKPRRVPQEALVGYYPAVVDAEVYEQVRAMRIDTPHPLRGKAASKEAKNLFGGLLRCERCGGSMHRESKSSSVRKVPATLICARAKDGGDCKYQLVKYDAIESAFLQQIGEVIEYIPHNSAEAAQLRVDLMRLNARAEALSHAAAELRESMGAGSSPTVATEHRRLVMAIDATDRERKQLGKKLAEAAGPLLTQRLDELSILLSTDPLDRTRSNALLRVLVSSISLNLDSGFLQINWKSAGPSRIPVLAQAYGFELARKGAANKNGDQRRLSSRR